MSDNPPAGWDHRGSFSRVGKKFARWSPRIVRQGVCASRGQTLLRGNDGLKSFGETEGEAAFSCSHIPFCPETGTLPGDGHGTAGPAVPTQALGR